MTTPEEGEGLEIKGVVQLSGLEEKQYVK